MAVVIAEAESEKHLDLYGSNLTPVEGTRASWGSNKVAVMLWSSAEGPGVIAGVARAYGMAAEEVFATDLT